MNAQEVPDHTKFPSEHRFLFSGSPFPGRGLASRPGFPPSRAVVDDAGNTPQLCGCGASPEVS